MGNDELTPREADVLAGIAAGLSNEGIAARYHVSVKTVERIVGSIFDKLGLADEPQRNRRVQAATLHIAQAIPTGDGACAVGALPRYSATFHPSSVDLVELLAAEVNPGLAIVLSGPGGVGKTRLAVEVARHSAPRFAEGARFVDLVPATDRRSVLEIVAATLGVIGSLKGDQLAAIVGHCAERDLLLVIDNAEHASASCAELVEALTVRCPSVALIVTSRASLGLPAEVIHTVSALDPSTTGPAMMRDRLAGVPDAVDDAELSRLCETVDGLPLGIELVAGRLRSLPAAEWSTDTAVLARNRASRTPRHESLAATIDWSCRLLDPVAVELLDVLSVFPTSFESAAVSAVAPHLPPGAGLALLADLVDVSLVMVDGSRTPPRYRLLETVRAVARRRLGGRVTDARDAHLRYIEDAAHDSWERWDSPHQPIAADWFESHWDDVRAAVDWAIERAEFTRAEHMLRASRGFAVSRVRDEHGGWTGALLAAAGDEPLVAARTIAAGWTMLANDVPGAAVMAAGAIAAAPSPDDPSAAWATTHLVFALAAMGRHDELSGELGLLRRFAADHPDRATRWQILSILSNLRLGLDTTNLRRDLDELARLTEAIGSPELIVKGAVLQLQRFVLGGVDMVALLEELERNTLPMARRSGALDAEAWCLNTLVTVAAMLGELRWADVALSRLYELRYWPMVWMSVESIAAVLLARGEAEVPAIVLGYLEEHLPREHEDPFAGREMLRARFDGDPTAASFLSAGAAMTPGQLVASVVAHLRAIQPPTT